jgi:hypothetical protein
MPFNVPEKRTDRNLRANSGNRQQRIEVRPAVRHRCKHGLGGHRFEVVMRRCDHGKRPAAAGVRGKGVWWSSRGRALLMSSRGEETTILAPVGANPRRRVRSPGYVRFRGQPAWVWFADRQPRPVTTNHTMPLSSRVKQKAIVRELLSGAAARLLESRRRDRYYGG